MKLSFSIMAVPQRKEHVNRMLTRLNDQIRKAQEKFDVVGTSVCWDTYLQGPWTSWRGAWETHKEYQSTHHVVLQDDILFCADLPETLFSLIQARPEEMLSGFLPRKSVTLANEASKHWVRTKRFLWAQCVIPPTSLGEAAMNWIDSNEGVNPGWNRDDDVRLAHWLSNEKRAVFVAVPHPVEHIGD